MRMKDFMNIFVILILTGLCLVTGYAQYLKPEQPWAIGLVGLAIMMICWGVKMYNED